MKKLSTLKAVALGGMLVATLPAMADVEVTTYPYIARGATFALGRVTVSKNSEKIAEQGICVNKTGNPTIDDLKSTKTHSNNGTIYHVENLEPATLYYGRAYATDSEGNTYYGEQVKFCTVPMGTITWDYDNGGSAEENDRINAAVKGAVDYWNISTSIQGFHPSVHYGAQTPTADCSYGGWMRVGPNASYQAIGTIMHEMNHGVGVGQHDMWYTSTSPLRVSGYWVGAHATALVRFLENSKTAYMKGDNTHMWPYGINGAHEDNHTEILYLANGLVTQSLHEDALPPVTGSFHTPSMTFFCEDGVKYYLTNANAEFGFNTGYLTESLDGKLVWMNMSADEAKADDSCAWYITFNPATQLYFIKNASTGHYITKGRDESKKTVYLGAEAETPGDENTIQISYFYKATKFNAGSDDEFQAYSFLLSHPEGTATRSLLAKEDGATATLPASFKAADSAMRWFILTGDQLTSARAGVESIDAEDAANGAIAFPADIYSIDGRLVRHNAASLDGLYPGIYVVGKKKLIIK